LWKGSNTRLFIIQEGIDPQYQWSLNNVPIANATNYFLDLTNISVEMAGEYSVTVSNPFGSVTSAPVRLTIIDPIGDGSLFWRLSRGYVDNKNYFHEITGTGWLIETNNAHDSIKCIRTVWTGMIEVNYMDFPLVSRIQTTVIGPGTVSFWWKAIHEYPLDTIDAFSFSIGGGDSIILTSPNLFGAQGTGWKNVVVRVPEGHRVLTWQTIDGSSQTSYLDEVTFIPDPRFSLESMSLSNENGFQFHLESAEGKVVQIERSEDLLQWQPFTWITNETGKFLIKDGNTLKRNRSFYRAIIK